MKASTVSFILAAINVPFAAMQAYWIVYDPGLGVAIHLATFCISVLAIGFCSGMGVCGKMDEE
jgi:hypothetical protein